jgi:uncharacterized membrane protein
MSLESNKTLGGIGAILLAIPFLNIIGIILVLIAMKGMGEYYNDDDIFKNALYGFIFGVVGVIALMAVIMMFALGFATTSPYSSYTPYFGLHISVFFILALVILYVFALIGAIYYKKSLDNLAEKSGEQILATAGLILLIGAAIPVIGEILKFIAWISAAIGFLNIKETTQVPTQKEPIPQPDEKRFCTSCGAQLQPGEIYCPKCGKKA